MAREADLQYIVDKIRNLILILIGSSDIFICNLSCTTNSARYPENGFATLMTMISCFLIRIVCLVT